MPKGRYYPRQTPRVEDRMLKRILTRGGFVNSLTLSKEMGMEIVNCNAHLFKLVDRGILKRVNMRPEEAVNKYNLTISKRKGRKTVFFLVDKPSNYKRVNYLVGRHNA